MSDPKQQPVLSVEQLKELVAALKAPPTPTEAELAEIEQAKADRIATGRLQLQRLQNKMAEQNACTHRRKDRTTHCVFEYMGGYLICQGCQAIIHGGPRPAGDLGKETSQHIYDSRMFNEHFVETQAGMTTF